MLKPSVRDLEYESPTSKSSASFAISDFSVASLGLLIELKYIRLRPQVKTVADEIAEDIWKYSNETSCSHILFVVYDPNLLIPDRVQYVRGASAPDDTFKAKGRTVRVETMIVP